MTYKTRRLALLLEARNCMNVDPGGLECGERAEVDVWFLEPHPHYGLSATLPVSGALVSSAWYYLLGQVVALSFDESHETINPKTVHRVSQEYDHPIPGSVWRHWKGNEYVVFWLAVNSETLGVDVLYRQWSDAAGRCVGPIGSRKADEWSDTIQTPAGEIQRFQFLRPRWNSE